MLEKNIEDIIHFVKAGKVSPGSPGMALKQRLESAEFIKPCLIVFDFELNNLFFANKSAIKFLELEEKKQHAHYEEFLENFLHPASYLFLQLETRINKKEPDERFSNIYCIKINGTRRYAWVYASMHMAGYTATGMPKLIYICFIEVEKVVENHIKVLNVSNDFLREDKLKWAADSLKDRELELLGLIASEYTSKEMSDKLNISKAGIEAARKRLMRKLGVKSVIGLVKAAMELGLTKNKTFAEPEVILQKPLMFSKRA